MNHKGHGRVKSSPAKRKTGGMSKSMGNTQLRPVHKLKSGGKPVSRKRGGKGPGDDYESKADSVAASKGLARRTDPRLRGTTKVKVFGELKRSPLGPDNDDFRPVDPGRQRELSEIARKASKPSTTVRKTTTMKMAKPATKMYGGKAPKKAATMKSGGKKAGMAPKVPVPRRTGGKKAY